ncbi:MAG TPA: sensor histidine kinase [Jatrophihabitantaceae bacterium]|jgi:signal transduction histidine kinase
MTDHESQARAWLVDAAVALAVGAVQLASTAALAAHRGEHLAASGIVLLVASAVVLVARRHYPVAVLAATYALTFGYLATSNPRGGIWLSVIVAFGTAIYLHRRRAAVAFLVAGYLGFLWGPVLLSPHHHRPGTGFALGLGAGLLVLLVVAEGIRLRQQRATALAERRAAELMRRATEERLRIARDLHDVLAHSIAVINVQANTALHLMDRQPEKARTALTAINDVSKRAVVELRSMLGVLRQAGDEAPRAPAPTLAQLDELAQRVGDAGLRVRVECDGPAAPLPADVDLAAYRIVQEALTNAARHSGGHQATVHIGYRDDGLLVEVDDDGRGGPAAPGSGLIGMAERAHALGGELAAGPRPGGGFRVRAVLPVNGAGP